MVGSLKTGDHIRQRRIRYRNDNEFESYIISIYQVYESDNAIFSGYIYKFNTLQVKIVKRSKYGNGCGFKHQFIEYHGNNCYIPFNGYCFIKGFNFSTVKGYKQHY